MDSREKTFIRGLTNSGSLCYLNSTLQQLFQFQSFRTQVLALPDEVENGNEAADGCVTEISDNYRAIHQYFLRELKALVAQLACADEENEPVDSLALAQTILDPRPADQTEYGSDDDEDQQPRTLDPDEQMDVSAFLSAFLGQLTTALSDRENKQKPSQSHSTSPPMPFFRVIQGEIVNELFVNSATSTTAAVGNPATTLASTDTERFFSLGVCVGEVPVEDRDEADTVVDAAQFDGSADSPDSHCSYYGPRPTVLSSLESSLAHFCREERVHCTWASPGAYDAHHVTTPVTTNKSTPVATKRSTLRRCSLPTHLFIHLKRFRYDHDKMRQVKVHDHFEFPFELDVAPYTDTQGDESETGEHSNSSSSSTNSTRYVLCGVIVHRGSARKGHYFSLVRQRSRHCDAGSASAADRSGGVWFKVDDECVSEFDPADMADVAFGQSARSAEEAEGGDGAVDTVDAECGADSGSSSQSKTKKKSRNRKQSAFMLVYDKVEII
jgi:hypothetical protein